MNASAPGSILHVSVSDHYGGSGRSSYRIHEGLKRLGWQSRMLVSQKRTTDPEIALLWGRFGWRVLDRLCGACTDLFSLQYLWYPSSFRLLRHPWLREADVLQLYNIHGGYFSPLALRQLSALRPIVWRLSDMWALTGHCSYSYACDRWQTGCGRCPLLAEPPALRFDTTALLWRMKQRIYAQSDLTIVVPSRWLEGLVRESPLLGRAPCVHIPNGVDLEVFRPQPKALARHRLGLPSEGLFVMFSARSLAEPRKGGEALQQALVGLAPDVDGKEVTLLAVGEEVDRWRQSTSLPVVSLGYLDNDELLATAYAAADLFVLPTRADNLPNSLVESVACGTPVVTFDVGGCREIARHLVTGYLAQPSDVADLGRGIELLLRDPAMRQMMAVRCRQIAEQEYGLELQAQRYARLYHEVLERRFGVGGIRHLAAEPVPC